MVKLAGIDALRANFRLCSTLTIDRFMGQRRERGPLSGAVAALFQTDVQNDSAMALPSPESVHRSAKFVA